MLKKIKLIIVATAFITFIAACSEGEHYWRNADWQQGEYVGTSTLTQSERIFEPGTVVATGKGSITFDKSGKFTMNEDTPLPGCHLETYALASTDDEDFPLQNTLDAYNGETNTGLGCRAKVNGEAFRAELQNGSFSRGKDGEVIFKIMFSSGKAPYYEYELRAHKKGWLW